jgi:hypothetical protein
VVARPEHGDSISLRNVDKDLSNYTVLYPKITIKTVVLETLTKIMFLGSKVLLVRGTENLTATYEPIV